MKDFKGALRMSRIFWVTRYRRGGFATPDVDMGSSLWVEPVVITTFSLQIHLGVRVPRWNDVWPGAWREIASWRMGKLYGFSLQAVLAAALLGGESAEVASILSGFGVCQARDRKERTGRNLA